MLRLAGRSPHVPADRCVYRTAPIPAARAFRPATIAARARYRPHGRHHSAVATNKGCELLRVRLDDQLLFDRRRNVGAARDRQERPLEPAAIDVQIGDLGAHVGTLQRFLHDRQLTGALLDRDLVARAQAIARNVHLAAVDADVAVAHELACRRARRREAHAIERVVEPALEELQEHLAGDSMRARRAIEVRGELALEHAIDTAQLLLLAQLRAVFRQLAAAALAVLAGPIGAAVDGALLGEAAVALQEELGAFAAAQLANSVTIPGHAVRPPSDSAPLGRPASVVRRERDVFDARHLEPRRLQAADGRLASRARALHPDFDFLHALRQHFACAGFRRELRRERRALARALVAHLAGARPRHDLTVRIGDRDDGVVEGRLHMRDAAHG